MPLTSRLPITAALCCVGFLRQAAAVGVTASPVQESSPSADFLITLPAPAATATMLEYTTSAGTAVEGEDYTGQRGQVTVPAGETSVSVSVPLLQDSDDESAETFSLIVWPAGGNLQPALAQLPSPQTQGLPLQDQWHSIASLGDEDCLLIGSSVTPLSGRLNAGAWELDGVIPSVALPDQIAGRSGDRLVKYRMGSPWNNLTLMERSSPGGVWTQLPEIRIPQALYPSFDWDGGRLAVMSGTFAAVYDVVPGIGLRELWRTSVLLPGEYGADRIRLSGRNLALVYRNGESSANLRVELLHDTSGTGRMWQQVQLLTGAERHVELSGSRLLLGRGAGLEIWEKAPSPGSPWALAATVPQGPATGQAHLSGSLLLVADPAYALGVPGSARLYVPGPPGGSWEEKGTFTAPVAVAGDQFGTDAALHGRSTALLADWNHEIYMGLLPGATLVIEDDDLPPADIFPAPRLEPESGTGLVPVEVLLPHAALEPVTLGWEAVAGSATAGADFIVSAGSVTIPTGSYRAEIMVALLADTVAEADETVLVRLTSANGAQVRTAEAGLTIQDRSVVRPLIAATSADSFEGAADQAISVQTWNAAGITIPWSTGRIARQDGLPAGVAVEPADFLATSGTISPGTASDTTMLKVPVVDDITREGTEEFSLKFALPPHAAAASWGARLYAPIEGVEAVSTDGQWTAVSGRTGTGGGETVIYRRMASAASGWVEHQRIPVPGTGSAILVVREGRLIQRSEHGLSLFRKGPTDEADWIEEASFPVATNVAFDGKTLLLQRGSQVEVVMTDSAGGWSFRRTVEVPEPGWPPSIGVAGEFCALTGLESAGGTYTAVTRIYRITRTMEWQVAAELRTPATPGALLVTRTDGGVLALQVNNLIHIFRHHGTGWQLEQTLNAARLSALEDGVLIAGNAVWAVTSNTAPRWEQVGELPSGAGSSEFGAAGVDLQGGVIAGYAFLPPGTPFVSGPAAAFIGEAGSLCRIFDGESVSVYLASATAQEELTGTSLARIAIRTTPPISYSVQIPWHTVSGTAVAGEDFLPRNGIVLVPGSVEIPILPDSLPEGTEQFGIVFGPTSFLDTDGKSGSVSITNRPVPVTLPPTVVLPEPVGANVTWKVPVQLPFPLTVPVVCSCRVVAGTAGSADAVLGTFSVTLPAGASVLPIPVTLRPDALDEGMETLTLQPGFPAGFTVTAAQAVTVEIHDATAPGISSPAAFTMSQGSVLSQPAPGLLAADTTSSTRVQLLGQTERGTLLPAAGGAFQFTPESNFHGTVHFGWRASNASADLVGPGAPASWKWVCPLNGQDPGTTVPGFQADWKLPAFKDSAWSTGSGLMGFGEFGPSPGVPFDTRFGTPTAASAAYLRHVFTAPAGLPEKLTVEFLCDDAAIFYLNGVEAGRFVLPPAGTFATAADTYALVSPNSVSDADELTVRSITFPVNVSAGQNLLAVSLHNRSATNTDLGFKLISMTAGTWTEPVWSSITVTDAAVPPVLQPDAITFPAFVPEIDSTMIPGGSLYANDGLTRADGTFCDPILEIETGGNPAGAVNADAATGHFSMQVPPGFAGVTSFTYRVRDKDGWSAPVTAEVTVVQSSGWEEWRSQHLSGNASQNSVFADPDADGTVNLFEYMGATLPGAADTAPLLNITDSGGSRKLTVRLRDGPAGAFNVCLEAFSPHGAAVWESIAEIGPDRVLASHPALVPQRTVSGAIQQIEIPLSSSVMDASTFFRLRASEPGRWWTATR